MNVNEILSSFSEEEIQNYKKNAIEMEITAGQDLDDVILKLENLRKQGKYNYFANFNGVKLYSIDVTMDNAYKEYLGCTKKTWLNHRKKWLDETERQREKYRQEALKELPNWIEKGQNYINPEKNIIWEKICISSINSFYCGFEIEKTIEIMQMLEDEIHFPEIKKKIQENINSDLLFSRIMTLTLFFAKRGPTFYNYIYKNKIDEKNKAFINKIKELNKKLNNGYNYIDALDSLKEKQMMDIEIKRYSKNHESSDDLNGVILIDDDDNIEGILNDKLYTFGKRDENGNISLAFIDNTSISHYYAINNDETLIGKSYLYLPTSGKECNDISINLQSSEKDFSDEIALKYHIKALKQSFNEDTKDLYDWFNRNIDSITKYALINLKNNLNKRLIKSLKRDKLN